MNNVVIIGATSGIGNALARRLSGKANLYLTGRTEKNLEGITYQHFAVADVEQPVDWSWLPSTVHGLVYCPGTINLKPFNRLSDEDYLRDYKINTLGAIQSVRAALPALKAANGSAVVLFSTVAASFGMSFHASIASAKAGVEGLTRSLAAELAPVQVRINAIAPSLTDTALAQALLSSPDKREASHKRHPLKRIGDANEIAALAAFLLSTEASFMTGQIVGVNGGMGAVQTA